MSLTIKQKAKKYGFKSVKKYLEARQKAKELYKELHAKPRKPRVRRSKAEKKKAEEVFVQGETPRVTVRRTKASVKKSTGMDYEYLDPRTKKWLLGDRVKLRKLEARGYHIFWQSEVEVALAATSTCRSL